MLRAPSSITAKILDLCRELNPAAEPTFIRITPAPDSAPNDCFATVRYKVDAEGGRIQFGWAIWEWPGVFIEAEHHAVYEPPAGPPWLDISPAEEPPVARRLFLPDDDATYDFQNEGNRRDNVRSALTQDPLVNEFIRLAKERNEILNAIPGVGLITLEGVAAERFQRNQEQADLIQRQLAIRYSPQGAPCHCGSGKKFKRCHGQRRRNQH